MRCLVCGSENREGRRYCGQCGAALRLRCPRCRTINEPDERFCGRCGVPLAVELLPPVTPAAYTPDHLREKILASRAALEGERKRVTVLFVDIQGSTALALELGPEEWREVVEGAFAHMLEAVHTYEGTVDQLTGDGIMALFGAPIGHEDHAQRAIYAALAIQREVGRYADELKRRRGILLQFRIGLNSGLVVVGTIGDDLRMEYTALGFTVNMADRMQKLASPGSIYVTKETFSLAEGYFAFRALGEFNVAGVVEPVPVYEVLGLGPYHSRLEIAAARGLTRFVGRDEEMEALRLSLEEVRAGKGQVVGVVGEPGVGKSRLVLEFKVSPRTHDCLVVEAGCLSYGKAMPFHPIIHLLKQYFHIEEGDSETRYREKVTGKVITLDPALQGALPFLLDALGIKSDELSRRHLDPEVKRLETFEAIKRLFFREARRQPVILIIEDLHWLDAYSQEFLESLVESLAEVRLLLLMNWRPEYEHTWTDETHFALLRLDPLDELQGRELLDAILGLDVALEPLKDLVLARTKGNPFFLEEVARDLVETGIVEQRDGQYVLARPLGEMEVPARVQAVLAARIDRLDAFEKEVLQIASVIGKDFSLPLLQAVSELPREPLSSALSDLVREEFLYEKGLFPEVTYTFKHPLTQEVAYDSLLQARRREVHRQVADALEAQYGTEAPEQWKSLAHHFERAAEWSKALRYLEMAAREAVERHDSVGAEALYLRALAALENLPGSPELLRKRLDFTFGAPGEAQYSLLTPAGSAPYGYEPHTAEAADAAALAESLGDEERLLWAELRLARAYQFLGRPELAAPWVEKARHGWREGRHLGVDELAYPVFGEEADLSGDVERVAVYWRKQLELFTTGRVTRGLVLPLFTAVAGLASLGDFAQAKRYAESVYRLLVQQGDPRAYRVLAYYQSAVGDYDQERRLLLTPMGTSVLREQAGLLGQCLVRMGVYGPGLALLAEAGASRSLLSVRGVYEAVARAGLGEVEPALAAAAIAEHELAERTPAVLVESEARWLLAEAYRLLPSDRWPQAEEHLKTGLAFARKHGRRPWEARLLLTRGLLRQRRGEAERARRDIQNAIARFEALGMVYHDLAVARGALAAMEAAAARVEPDGRGRGEG